MIVKRETISPLVDARELDVGDCFLGLGDCVCMRTDREEVNSDDIIWVINLEDGCLYQVDRYYRVLPIKVTLTV